MSKSKPGSKEHTFAKPATQAKRACIEMFKGRLIDSIGTSRTYQEGLTRFGEWMRDNRCGALPQASVSRAERFLAERAKQVGQKTLDRDRQAVQVLLRHVGKLAADQRLPVIQAERQQVLQARAYTPEQVHLIKGRMAPHNALGLEISHAAGLRAHELFTLARLDEVRPDARPADAAKFAGRDNDHTKYVVTGKGGLTREVSIPNHLVTRLETQRLDEPRTIRDRGVLYQQRYAIGGGQALSQAFSGASTAALGYSTGLHGVRHSYSQQRHYEVQLLVGDPERALRIVSQELGHFRPEITEVYLR
ncbi:site-specific integrase [Pseudomonas sp. BN417]|uniref:site-specific integrase n=1 Tax=Pseudomonas sp. BN417 TaxID=2567890 RepID=UPI002458AAE3|nr:site-specific integrase [Pseudomonas sp. BN417]MDH4555599.1 site-specific integrase [Pseudomonas sp. BN417]